MATCARCKKGLTDPISIKRGYGPVCWAKAQADKSKEEQRESGGFYDGGTIRRDDILSWLKEVE